MFITLIINFMIVFYYIMNIFFFLWGPYTINNIVSINKYLIGVISYYKMILVLENQEIFYKQYSTIIHQY